MNENEKEVYLEVGDSPIARILHYLAITATSDELLEALLLDIQALGIAIHPQLLSDARNTFNTLSQQGTNNNNANTTSANNDANSLPPADATTAKRRLVPNPYKLYEQLRRKPRTMYSIITAKRKKKAVNSNNNTIKSTGPGRPKGKKNKPGHKAGGNRKSAQYVQHTGDQSSLTYFTFPGGGDADDGGDIRGDGGGGDDNAGGTGGGDDGGGGGGGGGGGDNPNSDTEDNEKKRRKEVMERLAQSNAEKDLKRYAESFRNGSTDMSINHDLDEEDEEDAVDSDTAKRNRRTCQPADGSPIKQYLDCIHQKVQHPLRAGTTLSTPTNSIDIKKTSWISPPMNPVGKGFKGTADPSDFYVSNAFVFLWDPLLQYPEHMPSKVICPICHSTDTRCDGNWKFRPYHWWDKTVYVYHRRYECTSASCEAKWPSIRPDFLATLPTLVAEQFPFISPTERGPGIYAPMLTMMKELFPTGVMIGKFAAVINVLLPVNFAQTHISYLDAIHHWLYNQPSALVDCRIPTPFSPYQDAGGYCGFELKESLLKESLRHHMVAREDYMQASAQTANDCGLSTDDSHKQAKHCHVTVGKSKVQPFTTTFTAISLSGQPCLSLFKFTKSTDELRDVIPNYFQVRQHIGKTELLRLEGDRGAIDHPLFFSAAPSLLRDVHPRREDTDLPRFDVTENDYTYITTKSALSEYALARLEHVKAVIEKHGTCRISVDTEFSADDLHVVAIEIEGSRPAVLVHPYSWGNTFEPNMKKILELDNVLIIGCNISVDVRKLRERFNIRVCRVRDSRSFCRHDDAQQKTSLQAMCGKYLGVYVDKSNQQANYNIRPPLSIPLQQYAAGDAILNTMLDTAISAKLLSTGVDTAKHPAHLQPGTPVIIKIGGREVAEAEIVQLGGHGGNVGGGESLLWGGIYVGSKKALIKLSKVLVPAVNVPFQHEDWGATRLTLEEAYTRTSPDHEIVVNTRQIHAHLPAPQAQGELISTTRTTEQPARDAPLISATSNSTTADVTMLDNNDVEVEGEANNPDTTTHTNTGNNNECDDDAETNVIRSRSKSDIWHEFDGLRRLFSKTCPALPLIVQLCWEATTARESQDRKNVEEVLLGQGIDDFATHFLFNREWWLRRVRCPPRKGEVARSNLLKVIYYLKNNSVFQEYVDSDTEKYLHGWAKRCGDGMYEDLPDVEMYQHDGFDRNGLDLWQRLRGSRAENFHQKMNVATGPFGIGAEMAHIVHVILCYRYHVSVGINRLGEPDFGHTELHLEDRIQTRILEIWGILLFPNRTNVSQFKPLDFVAWGLGPLSFDPRFVDKGDPADRLKGDLLFMAKRMGAKYPPLPPSTEEEFGMIKGFCASHLGQKRADIVRLCETFRQKSDGKRVFPKLPSMIKPGIKRYQINQQIEMLRMQVGNTYCDLIEAFKSEETSLPPPVASNRHSRKRPRVLSNSVTNPADTALAVQEPPHVPPMSAPSQIQPVATSTGKEKQCEWWPLCKLDAQICGGIEKDRCSVFGINGKKQAPTDSELALAFRHATWSESAKHRHCYWGACGLAIKCGG